MVKYDWQKTLEVIQSNAAASDLELDILVGDVPPYTTPPHLVDRYSFKMFRLRGEEAGIYVSPDILSVNTTDKLLVIVSIREAYPAKSLDEKSRIMEHGLFVVRKPELPPSAQALYGLIGREGIAVIERDALLTEQGMWPRRIDGRTRVLTGLYGHTDMLLERLAAEGR